MLAVLVLLIGIAVGSGGGSSPTAVHASTHVGTGYFTRIETLAGTGTGSFAAAEKAAENNAINKTLAYTPYVRIAGAQHKEIALTFDDGPGPYTPQFVSVLKQNHVPATFFEVGLAEPDFHVGDLARRRRRLPDRRSHLQPLRDVAPVARPISRRSCNEQIAATSRYGAPYPAPVPPAVRPVEPDDARGSSSKMHMLMVLWTVDTSDYRLPGRRLDRPHRRLRRPARARSS